MKSYLILVLTGVLFYSCERKVDSVSQTTSINTDMERASIDTMLNNWHLAAAKADFNGYFNTLTEDAIFMGTDATEHWDKTEFIAFSKPFFDRGRAWNFTSLERHIYFNEEGDLAWFDELLNTQMKICRGSGVVVKDSSGWKIKQYVLSVTVPNDQVDSVVAIKATVEDALIKKLQETKQNMN